MIDGMRIRVEVFVSAWRYTIWRDGGEIAAHDPCWPENQTEEAARVEAVTKVLELLRRPDDPAIVSRESAWI